MVPRRRHDPARAPRLSCRCGNCWRKSTPAMGDPSCWPKPEPREPRARPGSTMFRRKSGPRSTRTFRCRGSVSTRFWITRDGTTIGPAPLACSRCRIRTAAAPPTREFSRELRAQQAGLSRLRLHSTELVLICVRVHGDSPVRRRSRARRHGGRARLPPLAGRLHPALSAPVGVGIPSRILVFVVERSGLLGRHAIYDQAAGRRHGRAAHDQPRDRLRARHVPDAGRPARACSGG